MAMRSDLRLTLKSSCDACTESKVKCSGEDPCARCAKKGVQCFYSPKKKRGPERKRERSGLVANQPMVMRTAIVGGQAQMGSMGTHERRSWSIFFTLYKHYAVSCSLFWFNRQLHKMRVYLLKQERHDALRRLNAWMDALNINVDELAQQVEVCRMSVMRWGKDGQKKREEEAANHSGVDKGPESAQAKPEFATMSGEQRTAMASHLNMGNPFHLRVRGELVDGEDGGEGQQLQRGQPHPEFQQQSLQADVLGGFSKPAEDAFVKFKVDYLSLAAKPQVEASPAFEQLMGYGGAEIERELEESGGGFLPWGGDVLSRILLTEADLLSFVQILAIKFNTLGKPDGYPIVREVPSVHLFHVNWRNAAQQGPIQCVVKCVHRERISDEESSLDVFMSFAPVGAPEPHRREIIPDAAKARILDNVELPPKRARRAQTAEQQQHKTAADDMAAATETRDVELSRGDGLYSFTSADKELYVASEGHDVFTGAARRAAAGADEAALQLRAQDSFAAGSGTGGVSGDDLLSGLLPLADDDDAALQLDEALLAKEQQEQQQFLYNGQPPPPPPLGSGGIARPPLRKPKMASADDDDTSAAASASETNTDTDAAHMDGDGDRFVLGDDFDAPADDEFLDSLLDWVGEPQPMPAYFSSN